MEHSTVLDLNKISMLHNTCRNRFDPESPQCEHRPEERKSWQQGTKHRRREPSLTAAHTGPSQAGPVDQAVLASQRRFGSERRDLWEDGGMKGGLRRWWRHKWINKIMQYTEGNSGGQCRSEGESVLLEKGARNKKEVISNKAEKQYELTILDMRQRVRQRETKVKINASEQ